MSMCQLAFAGRLAAQVVAALALAACFVTSASAHKPSDSYLRVDASTATLGIEWDIALRDLEAAIGLDRDADGAVTWRELRRAAGAVHAYALSRLQVSADGSNCALTAGAIRAARHGDGGYASLMLASDCPSNAAQLDIDYSLLFDIDPTHRGLVRVGSGKASTSLVLSPAQSRASVPLDGIAWWRTFSDYVVEGVWHIWIGLDHILFLVVLLLPMVLVRREGGWEPVADVRSALGRVLVIVTLFTAAHSITLWLAVMGYVVLPSRLVEAAIAATVIVTALHNLRPIWPRFGEFTAFGFGLIHGFGFAGVLMDLGLGQGALAISLVGFNVGVELGQLAIVAALAPLAFAVRSTTFYRIGVVYAGSLAIIGIGSLWFAERAFDVQAFAL